MLAPTNCRQDHTFTGGSNEPRKRRLPRVFFTIPSPEATVLLHGHRVDQIEKSGCSFFHRNISGVAARISPAPTWMNGAYHNSISLQLHRQNLHYFVNGGL